MSPVRRPLRSGRRPGSPDTRGAILDAARAEFAERSYDGVSMRAIAGRAGVDPALVHHYYGTKEKLFAAAIDLPFAPEDVGAMIAAAPLDSRGERMARTFFGIWEDPVRRAPVLAMFRSAMAHESVAKLLRQFARRVMVAQVASSLRGPDAEIRAEAAAAQLIGLAVMRYVLELEPLASASVDDLVALVAPSLQRYFDD